MFTTIGITGATGQLGRRIITQLKTQVPPAAIIALARSPAQAADLGVPVREADYNRPETLDQALLGIDTLLLISGNAPSQRLAQHQHVIAAAQQAGVQRIVYTSGLHADTSPLTDHRETEVAIMGAGRTFTILRNGLYTENFTPAIQAALASGMLIGSAGDGPFSTAPRADYAAAAVAVLTGDGHDGQIYELAGDVAFTLSDLAAELSRQTGKRIVYQDLPAEDYVAVLIGAGVPKRLAQVSAGLHESAVQGALFDEGHQLAALLGRPTTPLSVVVAAALETG